MGEERLVEVRLQFQTARTVTVPVEGGNIGQQTAANAWKRNVNECMASLDSIMNEVHSGIKSCVNGGPIVIKPLAGSSISNI